MTSVFVIINEWTSAIDDSAGCAVTGYKYFTSEQGAWEALRDIAHAFEDDIDYDATSFTIENPNSSIEFDEYYIQELIKSE